MVRGMPFIYNSIPSEIYNASLVFMDGDYTQRNAGSGVELITDTIRRNPRVLYLDAKQSPPLEFDIEVVFEEPVDIFVFTQIKDWLGGEISFKELQICADNFSDFYFNCYIELKEDLIYNGGYRGLTATVHCDAPWAWQHEEEDVYTFSDTTTKHLVQFNNLSADSETLRPVIEITAKDAGDVSIINRSYQNRETKFSDLQAGETVTLDNLYGFISSSTGLRRVANFNKVFLKMDKGMNNLVISTNVSKLVIRYQNAKRIGGGYY